MLRSFRKFWNYPRVLQSKYPYLERQSSAVSSASAIANGTASSPEVKPYEDIPGPRGLFNVPFLGSAFLFKPFTNYNTGELHFVIRDLAKKYGSIFKILLGKDEIVFINDPEYAKTVLLASYEEHIRPRFEITEALYKRTDIARSLVTLNGKAWMNQRKPAQEKMLRPAVVASYIPLLEKVANDFVEKLREKGRVDDLQTELFGYTTESVGMLCFNKRLGALEDGVENVYASSMQTLLTILQKTFFMPIKTFVYFRTKVYQEYEKAFLKFVDLANKEIKSQKEFLAKIEKTGKLEEYLENEPNFMYSLLSDGRLSDSQINATIFDLFGAGIDSTANAMVFILSELARNKDKQDILYEEIERVVGGSRTLKKEHIAEMSYLKACVKESMRKTFPTSLGVVRYTENDLTVGGYVIPKGKSIIVDMNSMCSNDNFFPRANEFLPERWLRDGNDEIAKANQYPFATKPFGFGARSCIGQRFAENEIFIAVTKIIQNFEISMPPEVTEIKTVARIFTSPAEKVPLIFEPRPK